MDGGEERKGYSESDPDSDPHIHPTVYFLSKQTDYTVSQYTGWKMDGGGDMKQGGRETRCKQRIRQRKGIINNMYLERLKKKRNAARNGGMGSAFHIQMQNNLFHDFLDIKVFGKYTQWIFAKS